MEDDAMSAGGIHLWQLDTKISSKQSSKPSLIELLKASTSIVLEDKKQKNPSQKQRTTTPTKRSHSKSSSLQKKINEKKKSTRNTKIDSIPNKELPDEDSSDKDNDDGSDDSEETVSTDTKETSTISDLIDYSALEQYLQMESNNLYHGRELSSYLAHLQSEFENPYGSKEAEGYAMQNADTMDESEASDTIQKIMTDAIAGSYSEVSNKDKERLSNWIAVNPALFKLYQSISTMPTGDVNFNYF